MFSEIVKDASQNFSRSSYLNDINITQLFPFRLNYTD